MMVAIGCEVSKVENVAVNVEEDVIGRYLASGHRIQPDTAGQKRRDRGSLSWRPFINLD